MEQRHVIKEIILKDMKITAAVRIRPPRCRPRSATVVPRAFRCNRCRSRSSAKVPQLKAHSFLVKDDKVVIVDPKDNKVAALIE